VSDTGWSRVVRLPESYIWTPPCSSFLCAVCEVSQVATRNQ
jgi:hypothetical protein